MQQKPEDTLTEHVNEFRRRYENVLKIRGVEGGTLYADFDLRDLLLKSLYKPVWASWISSRKANANLPTTFENLVLALKQAESDMILEGPSIFDAFMPSAHVTKRDPPEPRKLSETTKSSDSLCQCCGVSFVPKRPMHTRCDKCQADYNVKRKANKKKTTKTKSTGKSKTTKPFSSKAHSTTFTIDSDDSDSSDDDLSNHEASAHYSSFFCSHATSAPVADDPYLYFDNCSNLNIIRDHVLALNLQHEPVATPRSLVVFQGSSPPLTRLN